MSNPLPDRWSTRELPVLIAAAKRLDADPRTQIRSSVLAQDTGLDDADVIVAIHALTPSYLDSTQVMSGGAIPTRADVRALTERGRRAVGLWPSGENVDALVDALHQAEQIVEDPDEKSRLRQAAGAVGRVSRDVMVEVVAAVVAKQSGVG
jgi:hypothetical protein